MIVSDNIIEARKGSVNRRCSVLIKIVDRELRVRHPHLDHFPIVHHDGQQLIRGEGLQARQQEVLFAHVHVGFTVVGDQAGHGGHGDQALVGENDLGHVRRIDALTVGAADVQGVNQGTQEQLALAGHGVVHAVVVEVHRKVGQGKGAEGARLKGQGGHEAVLVVGVLSVETLSAGGCDVIQTKVFTGDGVQLHGHTHGGAGLHLLKAVGQGDVEDLHGQGALFDLLHLDAVLFDGGALDDHVVLKLVQGIKLDLVQRGHLYALKHLRIAGVFFADVLEQREGVLGQLAHHRLDDHVVGRVILGEDGLALFLFFVLAVAVQAVHVVEQLISVQVGHGHVGGLGLRLAVLLGRERFHHIEELVDAQVRLRRRGGGAVHLHDQVDEILGLDRAYFEDPLAAIQGGIVQQIGAGLSHHCNVERAVTLHKTAGGAGGLVCEVGHQLHARSNHRHRAALLHCQADRSDRLQITEADLLVLPAHRDVDGVGFRHLNGLARHLGLKRFQRHFFLSLRRAFDIFHDIAHEAVHTTIQGVSNHSCRQHAGEHADDAEHRYEPLDLSGHISYLLIYASAALTAAPERLWILDTLPEVHIYTGIISRKPFPVNRLSKLHFTFF